MLGVFKFLVWTSCAVGFGIFLAQGEIDGRTPIEHVQRAWKQHVRPSKLDQLVKETKSTVSEKTKKRAPERYSDEERAAIDRLIAGGR